MICPAHDHPRSAAPILLLMILTLLCSPSTGSARQEVDPGPAISGAEIIEYGLYHADRFGRIEGRDTSLGSLTVLNKETVRLVEKTTRIPAEIGNTFGIAYILHGTPHNADVELTIRVITPGLTRPPEPGPQLYTAQGIRFPGRQGAGARTTEQWPSHANLNKPAYDFFGFEHDWELVPGQWTFQVWYRDAMLTEQSFEVYPAEKKGPAVTVSPPVKNVIEYLTSSDCSKRLRAVYMVKVLGREAAPALPYLIRNLERYSLDNQIAFDCGSAKETPAAIAAIAEPAVALLIDHLADDSWAVREGIRKSLLLIGKAAVGPLTTTARNGRNLDTRRYAVTLLGEFKENLLIVPLLLELLKTDYFPEIRYAAAESLQKLKDPSSTAVLEEILMTGKGPGIRSKAAEVLGSFNDKRSVAGLIEAYQNRGEDWQVRESALTALVHMHDPQKVAELIKEIRQEPDPQKRLAVLQAISASDDLHYAVILGQCLADPDARTREAAAAGLIRNKNSGDILRTALSSADAKVRTPALFELARRGELSGLNLLPELLKDSDPNNRLQAALILAKNRDDRAFEPLMEIARLKDPAPEDVRTIRGLTGKSGSAAAGYETSGRKTDLVSSAIRGLGMLGDKRALSLIQEAADHQNSYIAQAALEALGIMPYSESIRMLIDYIAEDHTQRLNYTYAARDSLIRIGEQSVIALIGSLKTAGGRRLFNIRNEFKYIVKAVGRSSLPHLAEAIKSPYIEAKRNAAEALSMFREPDAAAILASALFDRDLQHDVERYLKYIGPASVKPLLSLADEKNEEVRYSALTILGPLGEKSALKPLLKALKNDKLRSSAIEALGGIREAKAAKALLPFLKNENSSIRTQAANSLGLIGNAMAIEPLIDLLGTEKDGNVQAGIIEALGKLHAGTASQAIIIFLHHENGQMRITAARSLLNIAAPDSAAALVEALDDRESIVRDYAYKALKKITRADCGFYPDAWRLWLERNTIPKPIETEQYETGILEYIAQFWAGLFRRLWAWIIHLFHW